MKHLYSAIVSGDTEGGAGTMCQPDAFLAPPAPHRSQSWITVP